MFICPTWTLKCPNDLHGRWNVHTFCMYYMDVEMFIHFICPTWTFECSYAIHHLGVKSTLAQHHGNRDLLVLGNLLGNCHRQARVGKLQLIFWNLQQNFWPNLTSDLYLHLWPLTLILWRNTNQGYHLWQFFVSVKINLFPWIHGLYTKLYVQKNTLFYKKFTFDLLVWPHLLR